MKRAVNIFFWVSVVLAITVVMLRKGKEPPRTAATLSPPTSTAPRLAPAIDARPMD